MILQFCCCDYLQLKNTEIPHYDWVCPHFRLVLWYFYSWLAITLQSLTTFTVSYCKITCMSAVLYYSANRMKSCSHCSDEATGRTSNISVAPLTCSQKFDGTNALFSPSFSFLPLRGFQYLSLLCWKVFSLTL